MTESGDGKISDGDRMRFASAIGTVDVIISVRGGATPCTLDPCSAPPCPSRDSAINLWTAQNLATQRCVRELIAGIGGVAEPDTFWLINGFVATLSWAQIQTVATHPDVRLIESNGGSASP